MRQHGLNSTPGINHPTLKPEVVLVEIVRHVNCRCNRYGIEAFRVLLERCDKRSEFLDSPGGAS